MVGHRRPYQRPTGPRDGVRGESALRAPRPGTPWFRVRRRVDQLPRCPLLEHPALVEERHPVGDLAGEAHLVGDDQHRQCSSGRASSSRPSPRRAARGRAPTWARRRASPRAPSPARGRSRRAAADRRRAGSGARRPCRPGRPGRAAPGARCVTSATCRPAHRGAQVTLSSAVMCGNRLNCWNTMPTSRRSRRICSRLRRVRCPPSSGCRRPRSSPAVGSSMKFTQRSSVDLPEPERPKITTTSPRCTSMSTPRTTSRWPKLLCSPSMRTTTSSFTGRPSPRLPCSVAAAKARRRGRGRSCARSASPAATGKR